MRNKILICALLALSTLSYSFPERRVNANNVAEINTSFINEKGKQYMRQGILYSLLERSGHSKSSQNIEAFTGKGKYRGDDIYSEYDTKTNGFVIGTTSQFNESHLNNSRWITGVSFGYLNSKVDYKTSGPQEEVDTIALGAYLGYSKNKYLAFGYLEGGLSEADTKMGKHDRDSIGVGIEAGKIFKLFERSHLYPYLGIEYNRYFIEDYTTNSVKIDKDTYDYSKFNLGFTYTVDYTQFLIKLNARMSTELINENKKQTIHYDVDSTNEIDRFDVEGDGASVSFMLGYYLAEDMLVSFETLGVYNKDYRDTIFGVRIAYTF